MEDSESSAVPEERETKQCDLFGNNRPMLQVKVMRIDGTEGGHSVGCCVRVGDLCYCWCCVCALVCACMYCVDVSWLAVVPCACVLVCRSVFVCVDRVSTCA